jgi:hypothetical protein
MNGILFASFVIAANSLVALFADQAEMRRQKHRGNDARFLSRCLGDHESPA